MEKMTREEELTWHVMLKHSFHALSLTLLSLVFPLAFLLLARSTPINDFLYSSQTTSRIFSVLPNVGPFFLHLLISFTCIAALVYSLTGHDLKSRTLFAWPVLCIFQACVTLGMESTITAGFKSDGIKTIDHLTWIEKAVFFVGLYEMTMIWGRMFVRPVVDDTVFGAPLKEDSTDKVVIGIAFSALWLCLLQEEVERFVIDTEKMNFGFGMGMEGFVSFSVGYVMVMVGIVRFFRCIVEVLKYLFSHCRVAENVLISSASVDSEV